MQRDDVGLGEKRIERTPLRHRIDLGSGGRVEHPRAHGDEYRREQRRHGPVADQTDGPAGNLADVVEQRRIQPPAFAGAGRRVEAARAAKRRQHEHQRRLGHRPAVRSRHVAHRDPTPAGMLEVDGVDADADFLNQSQSRRRLHDPCIDGPQRVQQHLGVGEQLEQQIVVGFRAGANVQPRRREMQQSGPQLVAARVVKDRLHRACRLAD